MLAFVWKQNTSMVTRLVRLEEYRDSHEKEDKEAHHRLESGDQTLLNAVNHLGEESTRQHETLRREFHEASQRGDESRRQLHKRIEETGKVWGERLDETNAKVQGISETVHKLVGRQEGKES